MTNIIPLRHNPGAPNYNRLIIALLRSKPALLKALAAGGAA